MKKNKLKKLTKKELVEITGGSEHSEAVMYAIGGFFKLLSAFSSGGATGSSHRFD